MNEWQKEKTDHKRVKNKTKKGDNEDE